jgi:hypothetical protein
MATATLAVGLILSKGYPVDTGACLSLAWHLVLFGGELLGVSATPTKPQTKAPQTGQLTRQTCTFNETNSSIQCFQTKDTIAEAD